ncbi:DNA mismatch repair protein (Mlh3), putative [Trichophyton benhamiae CBS 112371]|uniref:DNA mismatch repair protein (Mlh3), putative n=1 Tax=Arthroderma benhamiae (strain ATCC MYA-4681 / CBS 112371) TaxID=663331 RepID=D4AZS3_ARTBC|nr:DNA mismatch repair protein (Mlh3), putative [Trichophyton benhamiae CBS 112371]EFE31543.1 DNA mismatch repair protein (Mlh3), putative [Trichophyton benhamiae CBS 112371]
MDSNVPIIRMLPRDVAGQIRSSSIVTSLNSVIVELIKNSLDANASAVMVNVDFQKGACTVEDDGIGIPPNEFHENGGLGKLHHTSKFYTTGQVYGRKGIFISSLISMALVTITSHNISFQETNSVIFRHSKLISRLCPAPIQHDLLHPQHGTRVAVNDLFSNLPVRAKRRIQDLRRNEDIDREWDGLKRAITGLLLAFQKPVKVYIVDASRSRKQIFRGKGRNALDLRQVIKDEDQHSFDLDRVRSILGNAGYITPSDFSSWVAASARSSDIWVEAAISLQPGPTKQVQFISSGINPVDPLGDANVLFSEINQLFASSDFGLEHSSLGVSGGIKMATVGDTDAPTSSSINMIKTKSKGVNRWPQFYVQVSTTQTSCIDSQGYESFQPKISIQKLLGVIKALFRQFLEQYHFLSRHPQGIKGGRQDHLPGPGIPQSAPTQAKRRHDESSPRRKDSTTFDKWKGHPVELQPSDVKALPFKDFGSWSRVKGARGGFYDDICAGLPRSKSQPALKRDTGICGINPSSPTPEPAPEHGGESVDQTLSDTTDTETITEIGPVYEHSTPPCPIKPQDELMSWTDPLTKRTIYVNKRTGQTVPRKPEVLKQAPNSPSTVRRLTAIYPSGNDDQGQKRNETSHWFDSLFKSWKNPTFPLPELPIPSTTSHIRYTEKWSSKVTTDSHCLGCQNLQGGSTLEGLMGRSGSRLNKCALKKATVIAQVDQKFILLRTSLLCEGRKGEEALVLVDQHAADERCRVEELFAALCNLSPSGNVDTTNLPTPISFRIPAQEARLFEARSGYFSSWGCLYQVLREAEGYYSLVVRGLPTLITERCRVEPRLAIDMLRSEIWDPTEISKPSIRSALEECGSQGFTENGLGMAETHHCWLQRISGCPKKMVDLIVSRSCRSAIMFNDVLSVSECQNLVSRLAKCAFPFQCAHGRPSMVPIISLGSRSQPAGSMCSPPELGTSSSLDHMTSTSHPDFEPAEPCSDFVIAFSKWQDDSHLT